MAAALNHHLGAGGEDVPYAYFVRTGESSYRSTLHAQGAWQAGEQHMGAASGLVVHHLEAVLGGDALISRIAFDILGVIHSGEFDIEVETVRPGRTIELVEARMVHRAAHTGAEAAPATADAPARPAVEGRPRTSVVARVWRLQSSDTSPVAGDALAPFPAWEECAPRQLSELWPGGYIASLSGAEAPGGVPGRRQVWVHTDMPLVAGEADGPFATFAKLADSMNGLAVREDPQRIFFPNVDLTLHFLRAPEAGPRGEFGFDVRQSFGPTGVGITHAVLHDGRGPLGTASQSLTVRMPTESGRADG
ncbi:thioesterase family protein [Brevibacterium salitolerans]|uniref:Thioesterase family protein n=1 Tax=Brevibacterium salitolerans TaxID=1403566 RepID=A0ABP5IED2_9MICO